MRQSRQGHRGAALKAGLGSRGKDGLGLARQGNAVQGKAVEVRYVSARLGGLVSAVAVRFFRVRMAWRGFKGSLGPVLEGKSWKARPVKSRQSRRGPLVLSRWVEEGSLGAARRVTVGRVFARLGKAVLTSQMYRIT